MIIDFKKLVSPKNVAPAYLAIGSWVSSKVWFDKHEEEIQKNKPRWKSPRESAFKTYQLSQFSTSPINTLYVDHTVCAVEVDSYMFKAYQTVDSQARIDSALVEIDKLLNIKVCVILVVKDFENIMSYSPRAKSQLEELVKTATEKNIVCVFHTQKVTNKNLSDIQRIVKDLQIVGTGNYDLSNTPSATPIYKPNTQKDITRASVGHKIKLEKPDSTEKSTTHAPNSSLVPDTINVYSMQSFKRNKK